MHSSDATKLCTPRAPKKDKDYWQEVINQWESGNETQKVFCDRLGITRGTFSYWRHVLSLKNKKERNNFIPLKINKPKINSRSKIVIKSPNGYKILLSCEIDNATLKSIFNLLELTHA